MNWGSQTLIAVFVITYVSRCHVQASVYGPGQNGGDDVMISDEAEMSPMSDEKLLIKYLLENYESVGIVGRPVYNTSETISVQYGIGLIQILDLDEKNQILTTNVWCRYIWKDILMKWDPEDFGGVKEVRVPADKIWTPDIVLYNYADTRLKEHREAMCVVSNDGSVLWIPPAMFSSTCSIDITNFPFDIQTCDMKFGSWTYDGFKLDLEFYNQKEEVDTNDYVESNEWALIDHPARRNIKYYSCCKEPYPDLTFTVRLKRIAAFYNYILVLPCVLLSFLTLVIFWLPPESPAKILLGMNIFVAFFVLLLLLADITPPAASSIPLIGAYFCVNMILITLSTFLAVIVINTHIRGDRKNRVPDWLRRVFIYGLARALCMSEFLDTPEPPSSAQQPSQQQQPQQPSSSAQQRHHHHQESQAHRQASAFSDSLPNATSDIYRATVKDAAPAYGTVTSSEHLHAPGHLHQGNSHQQARLIGSLPGDDLRHYQLQQQQQQLPSYQQRQVPSSASQRSPISAKRATEEAYAASIAARVIQPRFQQHYHQQPGTHPRLEAAVQQQQVRSTGAPCVVDCRQPIIQRTDSGTRQPAECSAERHAALVASIERCVDQIPNGRALQTDIREIRRIIKSYVGRLQDRESAARNAKEWRIVARVFDRLFFMLYISTIVVSLATMFPKGE